MKSGNGWKKDLMYCLVAEMLHIWVQVEPWAILSLCKTAGEHHQAGDGGAEHSRLDAFRRLSAGRLHGGGDDEQVQGVV